MTRWSDELARKLSKEHQARRADKSKSWVKNVPTEVDGRNFPSKLHAAVYTQLKYLVRSGEYSDLQCEVTLPVCGKLKFKVDFVIFNHKRNCPEAHEAKGYENDRFKTIVQAWDGTGMMDLFIWKGTADSPSIAKVVKGRK